MSVRRTLRPDQEEGVQKALAHNGRLALLDDRRTGKTRKSLAICEALDCERILLVGLNSFLEAWDQELLSLSLQNNPFYLPIQFYTEGSIYERGINLRQLAKRKEPAFIAVNYEAWWSKDLRAAIRAWQPDMIIYDECHKIINRSTRSARFAHQIARQEPWFKHALGLTATCMEGDYSDIFSMFKAINPDVFGTDFEQFRWRYMIMATHVCKSCNTLVAGINKGPYCANGYHKGYFVPIKGQQCVGWTNLDELFQRIKNHSTRVLQSEVDILQPVNKIIPVKLSSGTRQQYDSFMRSNIFTQTFQGPGDELEVTADRVISKLVKAQEITGGWIQDSTGALLEISREKLDAAVDRAKQEAADGYQHAIYARFTNDIRRLAKELRIPEHMTYSSLAGNGKKGREQRKEILKQLLTGNLPCLIGIDKMVAYGLNLSTCRSAGFLSADYSSIVWEQLSGRLQARNKVPYHYHYLAEDTVDYNVYEKVVSKIQQRQAIFGETTLPFAIIEDEDWMGF